MADDRPVDRFANSSVTLTGSGNTVNGAAGVQVWVAGSNNAVNLTTDDAVAFLIGNGDAIIVNSGSVYVDSNVTNSFLTGSNDVAIVGMNAQVNLAGSNDAMTTGIYDYVNLITGSFNDSITESSGTLFLYSGTSETLIGSADAINGAAGTQLQVSGSYDVVDLTTADAVSVLSGHNDSIILSSGNIYLGSGETNIALSGSNDTIAIGAGDQVTLSGTGDTISVGSNDVIYAGLGDTVILNAGDSGDVIDMIGGTLIIGTGVSNITINGTGDEITGAGASLAGAITTTITHQNTPNGVVFQTITNTPPVVYNAGDIFDLVGYFEANPYLSQNQLQFLESEPSYQANLDSYLAGADLYGDSASLPSNVMAMLDGYSAVYTALAGVSTNIFSQDAYIEQQLGWAAANYPMPCTIQVSGVTLGVQSIVQNLMPALQSTNAATQTLVAEALALLQAGAAGAAAGNQAPMLDDATAEMLLGIAETPGFSAATQASAEVYTPGRSGHWQVIVNGDGTYSQTYKSPPLIQTVLADFDNYVAPIIDIVAVVCLNPEFIAATQLASSVVIGIEVASDAVNLVQAGQAFAVGDDLQGVFGVLNTIGGVLQQIGGAEGASVGACTTSATNGLQQIGEALSDGTAVAQGVDGLASGGNFLSVLDNALGAIGGVAGSAGVAGLAGYSDIQKYAFVGQALASTAQSTSNGNILSAIASLVQAAQTSGILSQIFKDVESLYANYFLQESYQLGILPSKPLLPDPNTNGPVTASYNVISVANGGTVLAFMDPNNPTYSAALAVAEAQVAGHPGMVAVVAHGNPVDVAESALYSASPDNVAKTIELLPVWKAGRLSQVVFDSCYTGDSPNDPSASVFGQIPVASLQLPSMAFLTQQYLELDATTSALTDPNFNTQIDLKAPNNFLWPSSTPSGTGSIPSDYINIPGSNTSYFIGPAANGNNPVNPTPNTPLLPNPNPQSAGAWSYYGPHTGW